MTVYEQRQSAEAHTLYLTRCHAAVVVSDTDVNIRPMGVIDYPCPPMTDIQTNVKKNIRFYYCVKLCNQ